MKSAQGLRGRRLSLALGTSGLASCLMMPTAAGAQCAPDPTPAYGTTQCDGRDADGFRVTTPGTTLTVATDARVQGSGTPAITVDIPGDVSSYSTTMVDVGGRVTAAGQDAIMLLPGSTGPSTYRYSNLALTVEPGGRVSGDRALALFPSSKNPYATVSAQIDNAGTIVGTGGTALLADSTRSNGYYAAPLASFSSIANRQGGVIQGGIVGSVGTLSNAGTIDGGTVSALDTSGAGSGAPVSNLAGGVIRSASAGATLNAGATAYLPVTNAGTIANTGTGAAVSGGTVTVANQAGGVLSGTTAIAAAVSLTLTNAGTITGDVSTGDGSSSVDSTAGTINGSVTFGGGNDTLSALYAGTPKLATGITGTVDGGGGRNTERVRFAGDTTVATPIALDTNFQQMVLAPDADVTATLAGTFATGATLVLAGQGTVVNRTTLAVGDAPAVTDLDYGFGVSAEFRNEGTITASLPASSYQGGVTLANHSFTNNGTVSVAGGAGVAMSYNSVVNHGDITASGTGVTISDGVLDNSGRITSTGGQGVDLYGNVGYTGINSGTITGATTGAETDIYLTNSGTISGDRLGVQVDAYGYLINTATGVVNGGRDGAATVQSFNAGVANAGTINGDVSLNGSPYSFYDNNLTYFALAGGTLNGNLSLTGATLVEDVSAAGSGGFPGITGTVTADASSSLRYLANADASATLGAGTVGPFTEVGYQVANGATLTLTGTDPQPRTTPLQLAGNGSVDLDVDLSVTDTSAVQRVKAITYPATADPANALSITNYGTLAVTYTGQSQPNSIVAGVSLFDGDEFTNLGTISVVDRHGGAAGIYGGASVTNAGSILLDGGLGIVGGYGREQVVNTGVIRQVDGGAAATGLSDVHSLDNQGTISVGGVAVLNSFFDSGTTITNSGAIAGGLAIFGAGTGGMIIANKAGGTITGTGGTAIQVSGANLTNAGVITGTVDLGYSQPYYSGASDRSFSSSVYVAAGGTIAGDLRFGDGSDLLLQTDGNPLGVTGTIDGGGGTNIYGHTLSASATVAIDTAGLTNFQDALVQANGADTVATTTASGTFGGNLYVTGTGSVVNQAAIAGQLTTDVPSFYPPNDPTSPFPAGQILSSLTNAGSVGSGVSATVPVFTNSGGITGTIGYLPTVGLSGTDTLAFTNSGTISTAAADPGFLYNPPFTVSVSATNSLSVVNSGRIDGRGLTAAVYGDDLNTAGSLAFTNSGTIGAVAANGYSNSSTAADLSLDAYGSGPFTMRITNSGTLSATGTTPDVRYVTGLSAVSYSVGQPGDYSFTNSGTISATALGSRAACGVYLYGSDLSGTFTNAAGGTISATGGDAYAVTFAGSALNLTNAGTLSAVGTSNSVAIQTFDAFDNSIINTGTIIGDIRLGDGADAVNNAGPITGNVMLAGGDDRFIQRAGGSVSGVIDGGDGVNRFTVDASGGTVRLDAAGIANFQSVTQTGSGTGVYSGRFTVDTIALQGGTLQVAAGQTLGTTGATTVTGGDAGVSVVNAGTIAGGITLGAGFDSVANTGTIAGAVRLGDGDDSFTEGSGSVVAGGVDGGAGTDLYRVALAGDRTGIGARTGFEQLGVTGNGTLTLTLDQDFQSVALAGTGLALALNGHQVASVTGTDAAETLAVDGDVAAVSLGGGNDTLALGTGVAAGRYDGGAGMDTLRFTNAGPVTLSGTATGFEQVALADQVLTVAGTLGATGQALAFGAGDKQVTVANGGTLAGTVSLGDGNNRFFLDVGGTLSGTVSTGNGTSMATVGVAGTRTLDGVLAGFQTLASEGTGTLVLTGTQGFARVAAATDLSVAAGGTLTAGQVQLGGANRFTVAGGFAGSVAGGAGDSIAVSGGSAAGPVAFKDIAGVGSLTQAAGYATLSGMAGLSQVQVSGGRLVGLAGSTLTAARITVGQGATFGSAGTVNGAVNVLGTLSPGASPGTMTVNGSVALAAGSTSLFELSAAASDKLVVNGTVSIASGATLDLVPVGTLRPGASYDLVRASGGINGSFSTVNKPAALFGILVQRADEILLLGQFQTSTGYGAQVNRSITYLNDTLAAQAPTSRLFDAVPALLSGTDTNRQAFARLTPEPYATASQMGVDDALAVVDTVRGASFAGARQGGHLRAFASGVGQWHRLDVDPSAGSAGAATQVYGFVGGVGYGDANWEAVAFGGYLNNRQTIDALGARTRGDGSVVGGQARFHADGFSVAASIIRTHADATTQRVVPAGSAEGRYALRNWVGDVTLGYEVGLAGRDWAVRPQGSVTFIRTVRGGLDETGGSSFALTVARDRHQAVVGDGALAFGRRENSIAAFRPFVSFGIRYQIDGARTSALAGYAGGDLGLEALGAPRARLVGTANGGVVYRLPSGLELFAAGTARTGRDDNQQSLSGGVRLRF